MEVLEPKVAVSFLLKAQRLDEGVAD